MLKIYKKYENGVDLIFHVERHKVDYFVDKEYKNTLELEDLDERNFIESDWVYKRIVGYPVKCEVKEIIVEETGKNNQGLLRVLGILEEIEEEEKE